MNRKMIGHQLQHHAIVGLHTHTQTQVCDYTVSEKVNTFNRSVSVPGGNYLHIPVKTERCQMVAVATVTGRDSILLP